MHDNVKDCLKELILINDKRDTDFRTTDENGNYHDVTVKDLQEINASILYNLADLLGMEYLYLNEGIKKADASKASAKKIAGIVKKELSKYFDSIDQELGTNPKDF